MILLTEEFNDSELKTWVFYYAKNLRKFSVCDISVISRGKHNLAYSIQNRTKGNYIQLNFSSMPKYINNFANSLKQVRPSITKEVDQWYNTIKESISNVVPKTGDKSFYG